MAVWIFSRMDEDRGIGLSWVNIFYSDLNKARIMFEYVHIHLCREKVAGQCVLLLLCNTDVELGFINKLCTNSELNK